MAYKPPKQQIDNNDVKNIPSSEAIYEALKYKIDQPTISGTAGQLLQLDGYTTDPDGILNEPITSWVNPPSALPSQSGNLDKVLVTDGSTASWQYAGLGAGSLGTSTVILANAKPTGLTGAGNLIIGPGTAPSSTSADSNILIGIGTGSAGAGFADSSLTTGLNNTLIGNLANAITSGRENVIIGRTHTGSGVLQTSAEANTAIGTSITIRSNRGTIVGAYGDVSLYGINIGTQNSHGNSTGSITIGKGIDTYNSNYNVGIGYEAKVRSPSNYNVAIGAFSGGAGLYVEVGGYNTVLGSYAGNGMNATSAANNVFLGYSAGRYNTTQSNELFIDNLDRTNYSNQQTQSLIYGQFNATPSSQVFTVNAKVNATYGLVVNETGGDFDTRIEGDTDANLVFVDASTDRVGIGTATPSEKLEVAGAVLATEYRVPNYRLDPHTHDEGTETTDFTINWSNGAVHTVTLNAAGPLVITMSNPVNGGAYALRIIQGATPGTVTWPANVKWPGGTPPTLSTNTGDIDVVNLLYFDDGGGNTFYYATSALAFA